MCMGKPTKHAAFECSITTPAPFSPKAPTGHDAPPRAQIPSSHTSQGDETCLQHPKPSNLGESTPKPPPSPSSLSATSFCSCSARAPAPSRSASASASRCPRLQTCTRSSSWGEKTGRERSFLGTRRAGAGGRPYPLPLGVLQLTQEIPQRCPHHLGLGGRIGVRGRARGPRPLRGTAWKEMDRVARGGTRRQMGP